MEYDSPSAECGRAVCVGTVQSSEFRVAGSEGRAQPPAGLKPAGGLLNVEWLSPKGRWLDIFDAAIPAPLGLRDMAASPSHVER
jgi:hypothetical protein